MPCNVAKSSVLWVVLLMTLMACAARQPVLVGPSPCRRMSLEQLAQLQDMVEAGAYPGVKHLIWDYIEHCDSDDALMGRSKRGRL